MFARLHFVFFDWLVFVVQSSKDLKKDQSLIHTLMGNDVALRKDFIVSNAINVKNLDI